MRLFAPVIAIAFAAFPPFSAGGGAAIAQTAPLSEAGFQAYLPQLRAQAERQGVSRRTVDLAFSDLVFSRRTVQTLLRASSPRLIWWKARWVVIILAIEAGGTRRSASLE